MCFDDAQRVTLASRKFRLPDCWQLYAEPLARLGAAVFHAGIAYLRAMNASYLTQFLCHIQSGSIDLLDPKIGMLALLGKCKADMLINTKIGEFLFEGCCELWLTIREG